MKRVLVSGCFDMLHSGHVSFFEQASSYGDLYVSVANDKNIEQLKDRKPKCNEDERLYMVKSISFVKDAFIPWFCGVFDFEELIEKINPDIFIVNEDGHSEAKQWLVEQYGIDYIVLKREPKENFPKRSTRIRVKIRR